MPRTVEGIVESHQIARDRRARGLPSWKGQLHFLATVNPLLKRYLDGDTTLKPQELLDAFHAAAKEVRSKVPEAKEAFIPMEHEDLEFFVCELENWTLVDMEQADLVDEFNNALDRLCDWCDRYRWWIKPSGI